MSGKAGVQGNAHVGMRQRLKAIFPKRFLSPASSARSHIAPPKEQTNSRGSSSLDVQTTAPLEGEAHSIAHVWNEAWNFIQSEEPDLVAKYQQYLFAQDDPDAKPGSEQVSGIERKEKLLRTAGCKVTDAKAKLAEESGFSSHAKRVAEGTVTILIKGAAFVAAVASNEPHAALVWAGCSVILPLLLNPGTERTAALEGFADAARILCRFSVVEADLSNDPAARPLSDADVVRLKDQLRIYLVQLYAMIIKLQIRLVLRYDRAAAARFFRDTVKADDWESLVKNIKELEESNLRDISVIGQHVLLHVQNTIELQGQQLALGFVEMTRRLQGLQEGIENIQRESTARGDATEDSNCVNAFKTGINYILQKDKNSVCAPESGQWFFHHPEYEAFRAAREPQLLFVTAEAGGGKSTTMRTLIDTLQASDELPLIAYFFFKDDDDRLRSYDEAMSTMIYQLLVKERGLVQHAREPHRQYGDAIRHQTKEMWQIIVKIASQSRRDIFCILDAVDECSAPGRKQLVADLADAFQNMVQSTSRLRFAVSSRPYQDENHPYADLAASNNTRHLAGEDAQVQSDIRKVIRFKVQELAQKRQLNQSIQNMLVTRLSDQNVQTRSFLAVRMAFELLDSHHRMHKGAGERTIDIILADIPQQLGDQFDEMLKRSLDREHAWRLFSVILAVRRTLKIAEFKAIYSLTQPTTGAIAPARSYDELEMPTDDEEFKRFVRSRCGLFITFVRNSVHLFHQTAREHLLAKTAVSGKTPYAGPAQVWGGQKDHSGAKHGSTWKGCISETDSNLVCATVCLDILTFTVSRTWVLEVFDNLNASNSMFEDAEEFVSKRPFFKYAAFNWHEHVVLGGDSALEALCDARYAVVMDISKPWFWAWFIPLAEYINGNTSWSGSILRSKSPLSSVWGHDEESLGLNQDYGTFLRKGCLEKTFLMDCKVHALLRDSLSPSALLLPCANDPRWQAQEGYGLIDAFHLAFGEYHPTSTSRAVWAMEKGDKERVSMFSANMPIPALIWTCITDGAPNALRTVLGSVTNLDWLHNVPEHFMYRRRMWNGSSSRTGEKLREDRRKGWTRPWPPSFATIHIAAATTSTASDGLCSVLADWVEASPLAKDYAQQLWKAGGFSIPSLCRRLVLAGASIHCEMWRDRRNALQIAAAMWEHDLIRMLLELGADPSRCSPNGYTALHWLFYHEEPFDEDESRKPSSNRSLRELKMGQPRYQKSRIAASVKSLARPLSARVSSIDLPCTNGKTPLLLAVRNSPTATETLLEEGAEPDKRDYRGRTALMHFFLGGFNGRSTSILKHLLHAGADSCASDSSGRTVLGYWAHRVTNQEMANIYAGSNSHNKAFHILATLGALSRRECLVQEIASLNVPLVVASRLGNAQLCWALLDAGADPDKHGISATSPLGRDSGSESSDLKDLAWNPVLVALWAKAYVTAAVLLAYGADVGFQVPGRKRTKYNKQNIKTVGMTPLHLAVGGVSSGHWSALNVVLNSGVRDKGCAFDAAAQPHRPVSKQSAFEMLVKRQKEHYEKFREGERDVESSDSEYEIEKSVFINDSTGAEKLPFDTLFETPFSTDTPCDPLLEAVISKHQTPTERQKALTEYMLQSNAPVNARTKEGITPLLASICQGRLDLANLLLKHGADPNIAIAGGCTPLIVAAQSGRRDLVEALLASGADPDAQLDTLTPEECNCVSFVSWTSYTFSSCHAPLNALAVAAERQHYDIVEVLLSHGADANLPIVHHVHGREPSRRERRRYKVTNKSSSSDTESEPVPVRWEGRISVATALTWARGAVRELLLRQGADPTIEEAIRRCDCPTVAERKDMVPFDDSDDDYPTDDETDASTDLPWRRRDSRIEDPSDDSSSVHS